MASLSSASAGQGSVRGEILPSSKLSSTFSVLMKNTPTDIEVISIDGKIIKFHKLVLAAQSGWFNNKICEASKIEAPAPSAAGLEPVKISIPDFGSEAMEILKNFLYEGEVTVPPQNSEEVQRALEFFKIQFLQVPPA